MDSCAAVAFRAGEKLAIETVRLGGPRDGEIPVTGRVRKGPAFGGAMP